METTCSEAPVVHGGWIRRQNRATPSGLPVEATGAQISRARAALRAAAAARIDAFAGLGFEEVAQAFEEAVERLPDLRPVLRLAPALRASVLRALVQEGAILAPETSARMGVEVAR